MSGEIPRKNGIEDTGGAFSLDEAGDAPDLLPDDMSLWIEGVNGLTVICGCCHSGVINTLGYIESLYDGPRAEMLTGGMHLLHAGEERLSETIRFINDTMIRKVFPAHCTGETAMELLKEQLTAEVGMCTAGIRITL